MSTEYLRPRPPPVNLMMVLELTETIIYSRPHHFFALSLFFLVPISVCATVFQSIVRPITDRFNPFHNSVSLLRGGYDDQPPRADLDTETIFLTMLLLLAYVIVATVLHLLAIGSISYSMWQGYYGVPLTLITTMKSSFESFFPLLTTLFYTNSIILGFLLILGFAALILTNLIKLFLPGLEFDYSSPYFKSLLVIFMILWIVIVIKLSIDWILVCVFVVVESVSGLTAMKKSKSLIKGMRGVSLSQILFFGVTQLLILWISTVVVSSKPSLLQIVITSGLLMPLMMKNIASTSAMYIFCKSNHGEGVRLPF